MTNRYHNILIVISLLLLPALARPVYIVLPNIRDWGINHLQFLSPIYLFIYIAGIIITLSLLIPSINKKAVNILDKTSDLFDSDSVSTPITFSIIGMAIFFLLRMPTNFLGDGYAIINNIGNDMPVMYKWTEIGAVALADGINRLVPLEGHQSARLAHQILSVVSGGITLFFFFGIAWELTEDKLHRLFIFASLILSGWMLLFFGYVENYPMLWAPMSGYIYFSIRFINGKTNFAWPLLFFVLSVIIHLQTIFFVLSLPVLLIAGRPFKEIYRKNKTLLLSITGFVIIAAIALFIYRYSQSITFRNHFLPLFTGRMPAADYAIFSTAHIIDIINQFSLLIPLWPILLYLSLKRFKPAGKKPLRNFLLSFSGGGFILILIFDPKLGMAADWDLFALCGLGPVLLMLLSIEVIATKLKNYYPVLICLSFLLVAPFFLVNLQYHPSIKYFEYLLKLDHEKSRTGWTVLRDYYVRNGEDDKADEITAKMRDMFPNIKLVEQARRMINSGQADHALMTSNQVINNNPGKSSGYSLRGTAYMLKRDFDKALDDFKIALELDPYYTYNHMNLGQCYYYMKDTDKSIESYRQALELEPGSHAAFRGMGMTFFAASEFDSSLVYFEKAISVNPNLADNYKQAGNCALKLNDSAKIRLYFTQYLQIAPNDPVRPQIEQIIENSSH